MRDVPRDRPRWAGGGRRRHASRPPRLNRGGWWIMPRPSSTGRCRCRRERSGIPGNGAPETAPIRLCGQWSGLRCGSWRWLGKRGRSTCSGRTTRAGAHIQRQASSLSMTACDQVLSGLGSGHRIGSSTTGMRDTRSSRDFRDRMFCLARRTVSHLPVHPASRPCAGATHCAPHHSHALGGFLYVFPLQICII